MKYYSKSNLKAKCRMGYLKGGGPSLLSLLGQCRHMMIEKILLGFGIELVETQQIAEIHGIPEMFVDDLTTSIECWQLDIGDFIMANKIIMSVESRDQKTYKYGKPIIKVDTGRGWGLSGMEDLECVDKRTGIYEVWDWKSGAIPESDTFENLVNGTMVLLTSDVDEVISHIYAIEAGYFTKLHLYRKHLDLYLDDIERVVKKIEAEDPENPSIKINSFCSYCKRISECPDYIESLNAQPVFKDCDAVEESMEEAWRLGAIEKIVSNEKKSLKEKHFETIAEYGSVEFDGYRYKICPRNTTEIPPKPVYNLLRDFGINPDPILSIRSKDLNALLSKIKKEKGVFAWREIKKQVDALKVKTPAKGMMKRELIVSTPPPKS